MTDTATTAPSTDLQVFQNGDMDPAAARHLAAQWRESQRMAMTAIVPKQITHVRANVGGQWQDVPQPPEVVKATVFAVVRYGELFGYPAAVALSKIDVIEGRLEPRYDALAGLMYEAGHQIRFRESSSETCTIAVRRAEDRDDPEGWQAITYTIDDARRAGLVKDNPSDRDRKSAWYSHPADMLVSKALKRACRRFTPDVLIRREDADLLEGVSVEQMVAPARAAGIDAPAIPAPVDGEEEPVDAELVDEAETSARPDADRHGAARGTVALTGHEDCVPDHVNRNDHDAVTEFLAGHECDVAEVVDPPPAKPESAPAPPPSPSPAADDEPLAGPTFSRAFAIHVREADEAVLGRKTDDTDRAALVAYVTGGRTSSTKEVRVDEVSACFAALKAVERGQLELVDIDGVRTVREVTGG